MAYDDSTDFDAQKRAAARAGISVQESGAERTLLRMMAVVEDDRTAQIERQIASHQSYLKAVSDPSQPIAETLEHTEQMQLEIGYLQRLLEDSELLARFSAGDPGLPAVLRQRVPFTSLDDPGDLLAPPDP